MLTTQMILTIGGLVLSYTIFQFGLFKWLISRLDRLGDRMHTDLMTHMEDDRKSFHELRQEITTLRYAVAPRYKKVETP